RLRWVLDTRTLSDVREVCNSDAIARNLANQPVVAQKFDRFGNGDDRAVDVGNSMRPREHRPPAEEIDPADQERAAEGVRQSGVVLAVEFLKRIAVRDKLIRIRPGSHV